MTWNRWRLRTRVTASLVVLSAALSVVGSASATEPVEAASEWVEQIRIQGAEDRFGNAIAAGGDRVLVGAPGSSATEPGAVYVYQHNGGDWTQQAKLQAPDLDSAFGQRVAISDDVVVVGGSDGTAVFEFDGAAWQQQAALPVTGFIAIDGGRIVVGDGEAAYVFNKRRGVWREQAKLTAPDGATGFGSVAISGRRIVANSGIDGAYVFNLKRGRWRLQAQIPVPENPVTSTFGRVDVSGDTITGSIGTIGRSAVYVFGRERSGWVAEAYLEDPEINIVWGDAAVDNGTVILSAWIDPFGGPPGFVHVYNKRNGVWTQTDTLNASDGTRDFGELADISGDIIVASDTYANAI